MLDVINRSGKAKSCGALDSKSIRVSLMVRGQTLSSWSRERSVSAQLVSQMISGKRPGIRGRSKMLREQLVWLEARGKQLLKLQGAHKPNVIGKEAKS